MIAMRALRSDVLVLGGGPAGAAAAIELSRLGDAVVLVETHRAAQHTPCQSLPPSALALLDRLGAAEAGARGRGCHSASLEVHWGDLEPASAIPSADTSAATLGSSLLIDRADFDRTLRERARAMGSTVLEGVQVVSLQAVDGRHGAGANEAWIATLSGPDQQVEVRARIAVIATGRPGSFGGRRRRRGPATLAVAGTWRNPAGAAWSVCEAGEHAWYWAGALPDGRTSVIAMVDPGSPLLGRHAGLEASYRELIAGSKVIRARLHGPLDGGVHATDASRQMTAPVASPICLRVGDAAATLDPLSSQGLVAALTSAMQGAIAVHTMLRRPESTGAAIAFCEQRQREAIERDRRHAGVYYARQAAETPTAFWRTRATPMPPEPGPGEARNPRRRIDGDQWIRLDPAARLEPTPALTACFIEERPALVHPALDRPIAFIADTPVSALLQPLLAASLPAPGVACARPALRLAELMSHWRRLLPTGHAIAFLDSLLGRGVLLAGPDAARAEARPAAAAH
jgi:flavin-dependent dehydrogenase